MRQSPCRVHLLFTLRSTGSIIKSEGKSAEVVSIGCSAGE